MHQTSPVVSAKGSEEQKLFNIKGSFQFMGAYFVFLNKSISSWLLEVVNLLR